MQSSHQSLTHPEANTAPNQPHEASRDLLPQDSKPNLTHVTGADLHITPAPVKHHTSYSAARTINQPTFQRPTETQPHSSSPMCGPRAHATPPMTRTPQLYVPDHTGMNDFAIYMAQRELVTSGMIKFEDRPDNYWGWKSTFTNALQGLRLTCNKELREVPKDWKQRSPQIERTWWSADRV